MLRGKGYWGRGKAGYSGEAMRKGEFGGVSGDRSFWGGPGGGGRLDVEKFVKLARRGGIRCPIGEFPRSEIELRWGDMRSGSPIARRKKKTVYPRCTQDRGNCQNRQRCTNVVDC